MFVGSLGEGAEGAVFEKVTDWFLKMKNVGRLFWPLRPKLLKIDWPILPPKCPVSHLWLGHFGLAWPTLSGGGG